MKVDFFRADSRGHADHGWLDTYHTFSFADYYNPARMRFGALRVLNDDKISGGTGFGMHPHKDMEIISIPLAGTLSHADSMGNESTIRKGEVQVMSAGTGIYHSEKNADLETDTKFLQIWVLPKQKDLAPRYGQLEIAQSANKNGFQQIVSPNKEDDGVWINQDAWFNWVDFDKGTAKEYTLHREGHGVFVFVLEGRAQVGGQVLERRDAVGLTELASFKLEALENSEILLIEVPMGV